jgi:outer membrane autotransporter protein
MVGPSQFNLTQVTGNLTQSSSGRLSINIDFDTQQADMLAVGGAASLAGLVELHSTSILPQRSVEILSAGGTITQQGIAVAPSALFGYSLTQTGNELFVAATSANFAPSNAALTRSEQAAAAGLQSVWNAGGNAAFGTLFATLDGVAGSSPSTYARDLNQLSPRASVALAARQPAESENFTDALLSCPEFSNGTALVIEGRCVWGRVVGRVTSQSSVEGIPGFNISNVTYQAGGQAEIAPDWFAAGALAFQTSDLTGVNDSSTGRGRSGYGGVALKWQPDSWRIAFALGGSYGAFNTSRAITLPGFTGLATASPVVESIAARIRTAYNFVFGDGYLRPYLDLDVIHARSPAYNETGPATVSLSFATAGQTTFVGTPAIEIGQRIDLDGGKTLHPFAKVGISLFSNNDWQVRSGFIGAPAGTASFTTSVSEGHAVGRIGAGVQLLGVGHLDFRLQYEGQFAANTVSHAGLLTAAWRF